MVLKNTLKEYFKDDKFNTILLVVVEHQSLSEDMNLTEELSQ